MVDLYPVPTVLQLPEVEIDLPIVFGLPPRPAQENVARCLDGGLAFVDTHASIDLIYRLHYRMTDSLSMRSGMNAVKISPKYQVVIPKEVRQALRLTPGQNVQVFVYDNRIELIPEREIRDMRGFLKGMDNTLQRENDRL